MTDRPVHVVPTRNCAEGVAALLELDPALGAAENADGDDRGRPGDPDAAGDRGRPRRDGVGPARSRRARRSSSTPTTGCSRVDNDAHRAVLAAFGRLERGFEIVDDLLR